MDVEEFKSHLPGGEGSSLKSMVDYLWSEEDVLAVDAVNAGVLSRLNRKKCAHPSDLKKFLKYLARMGAVKISGDRVIINKKFVPISQLNED